MVPHLLERSELRSGGVILGFCHWILCAFLFIALPYSSNVTIHLCHCHYNFGRHINHSSYLNRHHHHYITYSSLHQNGKYHSNKPKTRINHSSLMRNFVITILDLSRPFPPSPDRFQVRHKLINSFTQLRIHLLISSFRPSDLIYKEV